MGNVHSGISVIWYGKFFTRNLFYITEWKIRKFCEENNQRIIISLRSLSFEKINNFSHLIISNSCFQFHVSADNTHWSFAYWSWEDALWQRLQFSPYNWAPLFSAISFVGAQLLKRITLIENINVIRIYIFFILFSP